MGAAAVGPAIRIEVLPARLGDCIIVECARASGQPWRMLVDGGPPDTWPLLEARLAQLPAGERHIDVAVITHVDSDHIGGMIPFLTSEFASDVGDFWFNGRPHLPGGGGSERSIDQGESVVAALLGTAGDPLGGGAEDGNAARKGAAAQMPWNLAFAGGAIDVGEKAGFLEVAIQDGPRITVVSPPTKRLARLRRQWFAVLEQARAPAERPRELDLPGPLGDLAALAAQRSPRDASVPNGSSIALLVEHRGASVLLGADAFGPVLEAGLRGLAQARGLERLEVDAFKLPHHGSRGNVTASLLAAVPARHYLVSSNGDIFHHPDDEAIARVVLGPQVGATLHFNYRNPRTERWADDTLTALHGYSTQFPDPSDPDRGLVLELTG